MLASQKIFKLIERASRFFILLYLIIYSLGTLPCNSEGIIQTIFVCNTIINYYFLIEYLVRLVNSPNKITYTFSFYGVVDALSFVDIFMSLASNVFPFELFKLLRFFKLFRCNSILKDLIASLNMIKDELYFFCLCSLFIIFLSSFGIYHFENEAQPQKFASVFHSMWWAIVTLNTVGYGDVYPITLGGKILTAFILFFGIGIVTFPTALIATTLARNKFK